MPEMPTVFITGATGFMGRNLTAQLLRRDYVVRALVRTGSEHKLPGSCKPIHGDVLAKDTFRFTNRSSRNVHSTRWRNASKSREKGRIPCRRSGLGAAHRSGARGRDQALCLRQRGAARTGDEVLHCRTRRSGKNDSRKRHECYDLRPWYVLGPGRRWPLILQPMYWLMERIPSTRESAQRLGLVTIEQTVVTLVQSVETPAQGVRILGVPEIRKLGLD